MKKAERIQAIENIILKGRNKWNYNMGITGIEDIATKIEEAIGVDKDKVFNIVWWDKDGSYGLLRNDGEEIAKAISTNKEVIKIE